MGDGGLEMCMNFLVVTCLCPLTNGRERAQAGRGRRPVRGMGFFYFGFFWFDISPRSVEVERQKVSSSTLGDDIKSASTRCL